MEENNDHQNPRKHFWHHPAVPEGSQGPLADRIDHRIEVWELPSQDIGHVDGYGLCIIDATTDEAVIIGDGFRGDNGGEGGAGHRAAQAILSIYRVPVWHWDAVDFRPETNWQSLVTEIATAFHEPGQATRERMPYYIDHVLAKRSGRLT